MPADDPAAAAARSKYMRSKRTDTFARLRGMPLRSLHIERVRRGYSVARRAECDGNFLHLSRQVSIQGMPVGYLCASEEADASAIWALDLEVQSAYCPKSHNVNSISAGLYSISLRAALPQPRSTILLRFGLLLLYTAARPSGVSGWLLERSICQETIRPLWTSRLAESSSPTGAHDRPKCDPRFFTPGFSSGPGELDSFRIRGPDWAGVAG